MGLYSRITSDVVRIIRDGLQHRTDREIAVTIRKNRHDWWLLLFIAPFLLTEACIPYQETIEPANPSIAPGATQSFTLYTKKQGSDQSKQDITLQANWESSDRAVATINNSGLATAVAMGTTTITARNPANNVPFATTTLTVTAAGATLSSIAVSPTTAYINLNVPGDNTRQFSAIGTLSDTTTETLTTTATWSSTVTGVATIDSNGLATAVGMGTTAITAMRSGVTSNSATLTVSNAALLSIDVSPTNPAIDPTAPTGPTAPFVATGTFADSQTLDLTRIVTWDSSDTAVATISNVVGSQGLATALTDGMTTIRATLGAVNGSTTLTVATGVP